MGFGHDEGVIIGRAEAVLPPARQGAPDVLIVLDDSNSKYPNRVACEFMEKQASKLNGVGPGDYVKVIGSLRSKEYNGRWYTNFVAYSLMKLDITEPAPAPREQHRDVKGSDADDGIPF